MKKKLFVLYDDRIRPNEKIAQVAGNKSYGNIIFKQKTIQKRLEEILEDKDYILKFYPFSEEEKKIGKHPAGIVCRSPGGNCISVFFLWNCGFKYVRPSSG